MALRGELADGHAYLDQAVALGAAAVLVEETPAGFEPGEAVSVARVADTRRALGPVAVRFFGRPSEELALVGVTGTNGKTSTTLLIDSILVADGRTTGVIGTLETRWPGHRERAINTTPESLDLQRALRSMVTAGVDVVAMEVSSHGLALGRVTGCRFQVAALTNVSQDHLDFHATMEAYRASKQRRFREHLGPASTAVVNADDPAAEGFLEAARESGARPLRVSRPPGSDADVRVLEADVGLAGPRARLRLPGGEELDLRIPLVGDFNVENATVAVAVCHALGVAPATLAEGVAACPQVPGRVERVGTDRPDAPTVLVDYAHTPDAVEKLLRTLRPLARERLITVFGCGGDRDRGKRPLMAEAVARHSDRIVLTSDNPRTEDPERILPHAEAGLEKCERVAPEARDGREAGYVSLVDRRAAIELAVAIARPGDMVVIAGKGHEDYQILGRERVPFDDRREARRALEERGS